LHDISDPVKPENNPFICFTTNTYESYLEDRHRRSAQRRSINKSQEACRNSSVMNEYSLKIYFFVVSISALILFAIGFSFIKNFNYS
jgi:hypothetical protein